MESGKISEQGDPRPFLQPRFPPHPVQHAPALSQRTKGPLRLSLTPPELRTLGPPALYNPREQTSPRSSYCPSQTQGGQVTHRNWPPLLIGKPADHCSPCPRNGYREAGPSPWGLTDRGEDNKKVDHTSTVAGWEKGGSERPLETERSSSKSNTVHLPTLETRKLRHRETESLAYCHTMRSDRVGI